MRSWIARSPLAPAIRAVDLLWRGALAVVSASFVIAGGLRAAGQVTASDMLVHLSAGAAALAILTGLVMLPLAAAATPATLSTEKGTS